MLKSGFKKKIVTLLNLARCGSSFFFLLFVPPVRGRDSYFQQMKFSKSSSHLSQCRK